MSAFEQKQPFNPPPAVWNHQRLEERWLLRAYLVPVANGKLVNVGKLSHMGRFRKFNRPGCQFKASLLQLTTPWISHAKSIKLETCRILKEKKCFDSPCHHEVIMWRGFFLFFLPQNKKGKGSRSSRHLCIRCPENTATGVFRLRSSSSAALCTPKLTNTSACRPAVNCKWGSTL